MEHQGSAKQLSFWMSHFDRARQLGLLALFAASVPIALAAAPTAAAAQATLTPPVVVGTPIVSFAAAFALSTLNPMASPPGVNPATCTLTTAHPYPVVLINGTFTTMLSSFGYLGPRLAAAGYCVYGFNYGGDPHSPIQAIGPVNAGVAALADRVASVLALTNARKVDLVGFSQGGLISELYTKFGGAARVHSVTTLAPTTHGTTLLGLATLAQQIPGALDVVRVGCAACTDQVKGSPVIVKLNNGPIAVPGIPYTVIETLFEDIVTPTGSSFITESGVVNQFVQSYALVDVNEHAGLPFDPIAYTLTVAALTRALAAAP